MATRPAPLSEKEKALIAAAREEAARRRAAPAATAPRPTAVPSNRTLPFPPSPPGLAAQAAPAAPRNATPSAAAAPSAVPVPSKPAPAAPSLQERIAALMVEERQEKMRRNRAYMRWKVGAGIVATVLVGWWAISILNQIRHY